MITRDIDNDNFPHELKQSNSEQAEESITPVSIVESYAAISSDDRKNSMIPADRNESLVELSSPNKKRKYVGRGNKKPLDTRTKRITSHSLKLIREAAERNFFFPDPTELVKLRGTRPYRISGCLDQDWDDKFDLMLEYGRVKGTHNIPWLLICVMPDASQVRLGYWFHEQRQNKRKQRLRPDRLARLQALVDNGTMDWVADGTLISTLSTTDDDAWNAKFDMLIKYGTVHGGNCNVPWGYVCKLPDGTQAQLGYWLKDQRTNYRKGVLRSDRVAVMQELVDAGKLRWRKLSPRPSPSPSPGPPALQEGSPERQQRVDTNPVDGPGPGPGPGGTSAKTIVVMEAAPAADVSSGDHYCGTVDGPVVPISTHTPHEPSPPPPQTSRDRRSSPSVDLSSAPRAAVAVASSLPNLISVLDEHNQTCAVHIQNIEMSEMV